MLKVGPGRMHVSASRRPISSRQGSKSKKRKTVIRSEVGPSICSDDESDVDSEDDAAQEQSATRVAIDKEATGLHDTQIDAEREKANREQYAEQWPVVMVARPRHGIRDHGLCRALCAGIPSSVCQERVQL